MGTEQHVTKQLTGQWENKNYLETNKNGNNVTKSMGCGQNHFMG